MNTGQSTIEFLLSFTFAIGIIFFTVSLGLNYTSGYLVHYSTYMSSRTYLTYDSTSNNPQSSDSSAETKAREVFQGFGLDKFGIDNYSDLSFNAPGITDTYEYVGAVFKYFKPLSFFKILGGDIELELTSESFLGREPVRMDCLQRTCDSMNGLSTNNCPGDVPHITAFDNGC